jgi:hypothetical protein
MFYSFIGVNSSNEFLLSNQHKKWYSMTHNNGDTNVQNTENTVK